MEVATHFRWAVAERDDAGEFKEYVFTEEEKDNLLDALEEAVIGAGFAEVDHFAPELEDVHFAGARRYRRAPDEWPIVQTGLGVFSVHQANEGYSWTTYKEEVLGSLGVLFDTLTSFYGSVPYVGAELMYLDVFGLEDAETPFDFLKHKFALKLAQPRDFLDAPFIEKEPASASFSLEYNISEPVGVLILGLDYTEISQWSGYVMDTRVRSMGDALTYSQDGVALWLEEAHKVQRHAFQTLIDPTYQKSFQ